MKTLASGLLLIFAAAAVPAAPPAFPPGRAAAPGGALPGLFALIGPDYKKPIDVPESFFNPFKVEATSELLQQRKGAAVTEQSVAAAVARRGISGLVYAPDGRSDQVIIGDQVFRIGEELTFPEGDGGGLAALVSGATVTLREVNSGSLIFDFAAEGELPHRAVVSLRSFWRP